MKFRIIAAAMFVTATLAGHPAFAQQSLQSEEEILEFNAQTYAKKPMFDGRIDFKNWSACRQRHWPNHK